MTCYGLLIPRVKDMKATSRKQINAACVFNNKDFELAYENHTYSRFKFYLIPLIIVGLILVAFFCLLDDDLFTTNSFITVLAVWAVFIALLVVFFLTLGRFKNFRSYYLIINATELLFIGFYFVKLIVCGNKNFLVMCLEVSLIITIYSMIPNRWLNSLLSSFLLIIAFSVYCAIKPDLLLDRNTNIFGFASIIVFFAINSLNAYHKGYLKRSRYYDTIMLKRLINVDTLTGAYTRAKFNEDINKLIHKARQTGRIFSLIIFDIDDFKRINDTYGHLTGDRVLTTIVTIVTSNKRNADILTRWGGEEFILLLPSTRLNEANRIAERLKTLISEYDFGLDNIVTCSFGVTEFRKNDTRTTLFRRADKLLYDAKAQGKNIVISDVDDFQVIL